MFNLDFFNARLVADLIKHEFKSSSDTAIVLGSGLGSFTKNYRVVKSISYTDLFNVTEILVDGHKGDLSLVELGNKLVYVFEGRFHYYEGYSTKITTLPIVTCHFLGIKNLIISNAAGGINKEFSVGDIMAITDMINFTGANPLVGKNNKKYGPRFVDTSKIYCDNLLKYAKEAANKFEFIVQQGTYLGVSGPNYETVAEIKAFSMLGADCVGMSTVHEILVAKYFNFNILGLSCITNMASGLTDKKHNHKEILDIAISISNKFSYLVNYIVQKV